MLVFSWDDMMKTYKQVVQREGQIALSSGFSGSGTEPDYKRIDLIASIFEKSSETVRLDVIAARDSRETYRKVAGKDRGF